ncbi:sigma 54-interacting transcriptional regulator [Proteinivorax hydrogeniformans]|uniref:Sigma 54-interacting transcriptional regulator n=1 Tax=Proteinivorax hydrogeniformans TaxID=1826727 RepID=A0AAU8HSD3_9FIRM
MLSVVKSKEELCKKCFNCLRACPVNAIKVIDGGAEIIKEDCVKCGLCYKVCSQEAKQLKEDINEVERLLDSKKKTVALLDPSFPAAFDSGADKVIGALKKVGFDEVCDISAGAELIISEFNKNNKDILKSDEILLSSVCPVICNLIEHHYNDLLCNITRFVSPMIAMARLVRNYYKDEELNVVFIGACIGKKDEIEHECLKNSVDVAITFTELKKIFANKSIDLKNEVSLPLDPPYPENGPVLPFAGELSKLAKMQDSDALDNRIMTVEGKDDVLEVLEAIRNQEIQKPALIDILFCKGCISGPGLDRDISYYERKRRVIQSHNDRSYYSSSDSESEKSTSDFKAQKINLNRCFMGKYSQDNLQPTEEELREILKRTDKFSDEDELNCGVCGYDTCKQKAAAAYSGISEAEMCWPYMQNKVSSDIKKHKLESGYNNAHEKLKEIVGVSQKVENTKSFVYKASQSDSTVLLLGESGTGKGLYAQIIHESSKRCDKPFVKVDCSSIAPTLLESELFGYEEGAFTGALKGGKTGKFEQAHGGTIFLDEIGDMPLEMQSNLLSALQDKTIQRLGGASPVDVDVRVIAATNKNLSNQIKKGKFREDLFYRLNVLNITLPPLRERKDDTVVLVEELKKKLCVEKNLPKKQFHPKVLEAFYNYDWPGNIREMENMIERLLNLVEDRIVYLHHLPDYLVKNNIVEHHVTSKRGLDDIMDSVEKETLELVLEKTNNNRTKAAELLGIHRTSLYKKLRKHKLL